MNVHVSYEGLDEAIKGLESMSNPVERKKIGTQALLAGGLTIEKHAKLNADKHKLRKTGNLINSISTVAHIFESDPVVTVGTRGIVYAAIHEFGGVIRAKRAKFLSWIDEKTGERRFAKSVTIPARPYLRPAVDEHKDEIGKEITATLEDLLKDSFK